MSHAESSFHPSILMRAAEQELLSLLRRELESALPTLCAFACSRDHQEHAQEAVQEAVVRALPKLFQFSPRRARFETWMTGFVKNALRRQRTGRLPSCEHVGLDHLASDARVAHDGDTAPARTELVELAGTVRRVLCGLPPDHRRILEWHYIDGHEIPVIAPRLDRSTIAAHSLLARARRSFAKAWRAAHPPTGREPERS